MGKHEETSGPSARALNAADMGYLSEYGCWCYFEDMVGRGSGLPVDKVDQMCKDLQHGYECIMMDSVEDGQACIPWDTPYESAFGQGFASKLGGMSMQSLQEECRINNPPDSCAEWTCMVEGWFVQSWFTFHVFGGGFNMAFSHRNGFDPEEECGLHVAEPTPSPTPPESPGVVNVFTPWDGYSPFKPTDITGDSQGPMYSLDPIEGTVFPFEPTEMALISVPITTLVDCCGDYPLRYPYKHNGGKQCCGQHTYNIYVKNCCRDGSVRDICPA